MSTGPAFSVVIPTRNRGALLSTTLRSVLAQTWTDFEVVVSDNASADDTEAVAREAGDPRVRYVRSDEALLQPDSWEFALSHARGEWLTVLGDDDGLVPSALDRLAGIVGGADDRPVVWGEAWYYDPDFPPAWITEDETNRITLDPFSGTLDEVGAGAALRDLFAMRPHSPPGMFNALVHRGTLGRVRARRGRVFGHPDPFVASGVAVLLEEPSFRALRMPLTVRGIAQPTLSLNFVRNTRDAHEGVREFDTADLFSLAPLRERTLANLVAESLLRMKAELPEELAGYELDLVRYFVTTRQELDDPRRRDDGGTAKAEWRDVLRAQPGEVRAAVRRERLRGRAAAEARRLAHRIPGARTLYRAVRGGTDGVVPFHLLDGRDLGFHDLPSAALYLDRHILSTRVAA